MEAFLSTLPPYVHDFLGKHPPTDVFNLLRELICFAVLYSDDRARINTSSEVLLKKRQDQIVKHEVEVEEEEKEEATVPEQHIVIEPIKEETETEIKESVKETEITAKPTYNVRTGELIQQDNKSKMPNTFPEWWGHQESEPQQHHVQHHVVPATTTTIRKEEIHEAKSSNESYGTSWISWDSTPATHNNNPHHLRMERAKSLIIPDLRSYPEENHNTAKITSSHTSPPVTSNTAKRHSTLNVKSSTSPPARSTNSPIPRTINTASPTPASKASRRLSAPVCDSPTSTSGAIQSKFVVTTTKQQKLREANSRSPSNSNSTGTKTTTRSASVVLKQPRENAAMRARAEHARLQQEELSKKKSTTPPGSSTSLRLKQRVNSGIDWNAIKRERRNTVAEESVSKKE